MVGLVDVQKSCSRESYYGDKKGGIGGTLSRRFTSTIVQSEDRKKAQRRKSETRHTDNRDRDQTMRRISKSHDSKVPVERTSPDLRCKKKG